MTKLVNAFNPATIRGLMCRNLISLDWLENLCNCDFNQMLELSVRSNLSQIIFNLNLEAPEKRQIMTANHCFGCAAGAGSSCGGTVA